MGNVLYFLGAGASASGGAPVMGNFLDVADALRHSGRLGTDVAAFAAVFNGISALKTVQAQITIDTYNLETAFSALEMASLLKRLGPTLSESEILAARDGMVRVICRTLQCKMMFPTDNNQRVRAPHCYDQFASFLDDCQRQPYKWPNIRGNPSILTANYDFGLDYGLDFHKIRYSYVLDGLLAPNTILLAKLHGSMNWLTCSTCSKTLSVPLALAANRLGLNAQHAADYEVEFDLSLDLSRLQCCGQTLINQTTIVPPTWNKGKNSPGLEAVWQQAAKALSEAEYLFFIGYSFPSSDEYMRHLLALGLAGETRIRRIVVINPDPEAFTRLRSLLSPSLAPRTYHENFKFNEVLEPIARHLQES